MNYRDKLEIIADILSVASRSAKRTQIMYKANLSYSVMRRYLDEVVDASLLSFEPDSQRYLLTEKGKRFLADYKTYFRTSQGVQKRISDLKSKKRTLELLCSSCKQPASVEEPV